jgi:putative endonuclease
MSTREFGMQAEDAAARFLQNRNYRIVARNYKTLCGEVDIIARDRETLVFVEVKARVSCAFGQPFEAVGARKQERLRRVALLYLKKIGTELPVRFDVISISAGSGQMLIDHIEGAF